MINAIIKSVETLDVADFGFSPIWAYTNSDSNGEINVKPIKRWPVTTLANKIVGDQVTLSDGTKVFAIIGNIDVSNARLTEHFLTITILNNGQRFNLSRYHDFDYAENGPDQLASFLSMKVDNVFPISFDIKRFVKDAPNFLNGKILKEPSEKLTRAQVIAMAVL